jgi:peroxiredoxin Q/BCP
MVSAPDFELQNDSGKIVRLGDFRGQKWVVLFFYPKDGTPFCSLEICAFREKYQSFVSAEAVLLGISPDLPETHRAFRQRLRIPFDLLSDPDGRVREAYGVPKMLGLLPGRATYIINPSGSIEYSFLGQFDPCKHADIALRTILLNNPEKKSVIPHIAARGRTMLPVLKHVVESYMDSRPAQPPSEDFVKQDRYR